MDNISWKSWAFQACAHIRFKPDRAAVEEELLAHLEDKAEAILRDAAATGCSRVVAIGGGTVIDQGAGGGRRGEH